MDMVCPMRAEDLYWTRNSRYTGSAFMEFSTRSPFLDPFGKPLPEHIQHALRAVTSRLRRKFSMIRDDVVYTEILEQAGHQIVNHEAIHGTIKRLYGFAWVVVRNVAISRMRRGPHLLEQPIAGSVEAETTLARLTAEDGSPERIEASILVHEALAQISDREGKIAIWKKAGFSTKEIAKELGMSVSAVDTTYARLLDKLRQLLGSGSDTRE